MPLTVTVHVDNARGFADPRLHVWYTGSTRTEDHRPTGKDGFGPVFEVRPVRPTFGFTLRDGERPEGPWEGVDHVFHPVGRIDGERVEVWACARSPFTYRMQPSTPTGESAEAYLSRLRDAGAFRPGGYLPGSGGLSGLGATPLTDGRMLVGLHHPTAATVHLTGDFNGWQHPWAEQPDPDRFVPLTPCSAYGGRSWIWLGITDRLPVGGEYRFVVAGGVAQDVRVSVDPYARQLGPDFARGNSVVVDPTTYHWHDAGWRRPRIDELVLYELSVAGFSEADADIEPAARGRFAGVTARIENGYFERLGVNALSIMPLAEVPSPQGPSSIGYDPSLFMTVERDFGTPDDLRALVDAAHAHGIAVLVDVVFNHTSNDDNPLWGLVLRWPNDFAGGLYFNPHATRWGNRVATERPLVQHMLVDACKLLLVEYHVDGFRLDATHWTVMDHGFLHRLARELHDLVPDVVLVAENLPNETDLNRSGYDGYAQWAELFHDKVKALLRETPWEGQDATPDRLADALYFSRSWFAAHTNNVVNYCQSHDEDSVAQAVGAIPGLDRPETRDRKGRLGLLATMVALGQPMIYMGQEFNLSQPRNVVTVDWPPRLDDHAFFGWASRLIHLRRRYPGLRLAGYDPAGEGRHAWILGPWMDVRHGGGRAVVGWRARPNDDPWDTLVVLLNFTPYDAEVDLELGRPGSWVKLADIDTVEDIPPAGRNWAGAPTALHSQDGRCAPFVLPSSSGFVYKWEAAP
ncbi:alpha-amylase family glycosyl hydrolase [Geodermatophilus obscurus]|uniref:Alpha amylase catalytic region n=1 Tax=Geodermatophilus obscurus (strain ATCC 25078 / DSM 43160 / JCM 3152 / CCUG 61914 / KCC A-0152 / KCTC 9177 / NBRC 13315 / NRRL B-3577 / G-20) TaxID=526225 RepID=D2SAM5_GEOOG|nr:alpha-amylase family glycosyl hydrolase [Geodermatophilus obscurus]ADB73954.1 alpha amylase catalytic region [Geodermatophilus obscurus DSM 43160]